MTKHLQLLSTKEDEFFKQKIQEFVNGKMENFAREYELAKQVEESMMRKRESKRPMQSSSSEDEQVEESNKRKRESKRPMKSSSSDDEIDKQVKESKKRKIEPKRPLKKLSFANDEDAYKKKLKKQKQRKIQKEIEKRINSQPPISNEVTERLKEFITNDLNGSDIKLVIQKLLYSSDIKPDQNRLSMPINQLIKTSNFLTPQEKSFLDKKGEFDVQLLGPTLQMYKLPMRLMIWDMVSTQSYILKTNWSGFVKDNEEDLKENSIIQVWSFRKDQQLCLALAVVERPDPMFSVEECSPSSS